MNQLILLSSQRFGMAALEESTLELPADMLTHDPSSSAAFSARYRSVGVKGLLKGPAVIP